MSLQQIYTALPALLQGSVLTIELTILSVLFGLVLGLFLALGRLSKKQIYR